MGLGGHVLPVGAVVIQKFAPLPSTGSRRRASRRRPCPELRPLPTRTGAWASAGSPAARWRPRAPPPPPGHVRTFLLYQLEQVLGHRRDLPPLDADLALPVLSDYKVDSPELVVGTVVVEPPLGTPVLLALQRGPQDDLAYLHEVPDVLRRVPAGVEEPGAGHAHLRQPVLEVQDLAEPLLQGVPISHEVGVLHHRRLELLLDKVGALALLLLLQRLEHPPDRRQH